MCCFFSVDFEKLEIIPHISDLLTCKNVIIIKSQCLLLNWKQIWQMVVFKSWQLYELCSYFFLTLLSEVLY